MRPWVEKAEKDWKDEEDPFGVRSTRFEEEGKILIDDYKGEVQEIKADTPGN